jgi:hypothetical protein
VRLAPGGIAVLVAAAKRGKTSRGACMLLEHARDRGPSIAMSLELPAHELVARTFGTRCDASWAGVLRGEPAMRHEYSLRPKSSVEYSAIAIDDRSSTFALGAADGNVEIHRLSDGQLVQKLTGASAPVVTCRSVTTARVSLQGCKARTINQCRWRSGISRHELRRR